MPKSLARPSRAELVRAAHKTVPDCIKPGIGVLFAGINPGLYSAYSGRHFAHPGNRFWPALHAGGFTPRVLDPRDEHQLLNSGIGITNIVDRATVGSAELRDEELVEGGRRLARKIRRYKPRAVAILGVVAYRTAFNRPNAKVGKQRERIEGAEVWVLPNPSGLNAHFTPKTLARLFRAFRRAAKEALRSRPAAERVSTD